MTYIQITTRCNMSCAHCGMRCGKKGNDMSMKVWNRAVEFSERFDSSIAIGGGEPTLHKNFRHYLLDAISVEHEMPMFIATNGSVTKYALLLAKLAKTGVISAALSQDCWHDPIDDEVIDAFTRHDSSYNRDENDLREIRCVENGVAAMGRAKDNDLSDDERCICNGWFIDPVGNLKPCGCEDAPIICNIMEHSWNEIENIISELDGSGELGQECWKDCENLKVDSLAEAV